MTGRRARSVRVAASATGALALVIVGLIVGGFNERGFQRRQAQSLSAQAQVLAATVEPALVFLDNTAAEELVTALRADGRIEAAGVYDSAGRRVAELSRNAESAPLRAAEVNLNFAHGRTVAAVPVLHEGRRIGLVYLRFAPEPLGEVVQRHAGLALLLLMAMIVLASGNAVRTALSRAARESEARAVELAELNDRLEEQIRRRESAEDALRQAQKMETLGQLTGGIAHDFNNLLQTVQGALDLIARRAGEQLRVERWARMGLEAAERGARLTSQLLAFSRSQKLEMRPVKAGQVVERLRELLPTTLGAGVGVIFDLSESEPLVVADPTQLDLAVINLCINARDAMPNGGEVRVSTRTETLEGDAELKSGDYLLLSVTDTGVGMPTDIRARAFDPFFTTKGVGKGTGLGLSQVYGIAKQAGGTVRIDSVAGQGTTVTIYLPVADGTPAPAMSDRVTRLVSACAGAQVLVVDDDAGVRTYVCDALTTLGYECFDAADGVAGLEILDRQPVDLLIVDYAMPGMSGAEVATAALARNPDLPIIFASGYADSAALEAAVGRPAQLLRKPFDSEALGSRVAEALAARAS